MLRRSRRLLEGSDRDDDAPADQSGPSTQPDDMDQPGDQPDHEQSDRPPKKKKRSSMAEMVRAEVAKAISDLNAQTSTPPVLTPIDQPRDNQTIHQNSAVAAPINSLEQSVNAILAPDQGTINPSVNSIASFDLPLGSNLSDRLRSKIISGEYVDLSTIINPSGNQEIVGLNIGLDDTQGSGNPFIKVNNKPRAIQSINTWTSAMLIYASIYLSHHTGEVAPLLQYIEFIRKMAAHGHGWRFYDEAFRRSKSSQNLKWDVPLINQYIAALSGPSSNRQNKGTFRPFGGSQKSANVPNGFCFEYHKQGECSRQPNCRYLHKCFSCKGNHSFSKCRDSQTKKSG